MPAVLPQVDFTQSGPYRSRKHATVPATRLTQAQVLLRFVRPSLHPPAGLMQARHADPFGEEGFGAWTRERLLYWFIRPSNQWAGAACEALGAARVHFAPYQVRYPIRRSAEALDGRVTSANGWLSDKDSGIMFYVLRPA